MFIYISAFNSGKPNLIAMIEERFTALNRTWTYMPKKALWFCLYRHQIFKLSHYERCCGLRHHSLIALALQFSFLYSLIFWNTIIFSLPKLHCQSLKLAPAEQIRLTASQENCPTCKRSIRWYDYEFMVGYLYQKSMMTNQILLGACGNRYLIIAVLLYNDISAVHWMYKYMNPSNVGCISRALWLLPVDTHTLQQETLKHCNWLH